LWHPCGQFDILLLWFANSIKELKKIEAIFYWLILVYLGCIFGIPPCNCAVFSGVPDEATTTYLHWSHLVLLSGHIGVSSP
jgi:hypothetical protein